MQFLVSSIALLYHYRTTRAFVQNKFRSNKMTYLQLYNIYMTRKLLSARISNILTILLQYITQKMKSK